MYHTNEVFSTTTNHDALLFIACITTILLVLASTSMTIVIASNIARVLVLPLERTSPGTFTHHLSLHRFLRQSFHQTSIEIML